MASTYAAEAATQFARRLIATMRAGEDKRGRHRRRCCSTTTRSARCSISPPTTIPTRSLKIERLEAISRQSWVHVRPLLPSRSNAVGLLDHPQADAHISASIAEGYQ
jgi:hypothetical protein